MLENRDCPVCNGKEKELVYKQNFIDIPGLGLDKFEQNVVICKNCGMVFVSPFIDDENLSNYYSYMSAYEYAENNYEFSESVKKRSDRQFSYLIKYIDKNAKVLDIGSSIGYFVSLFQKNGNISIGVEPSELNKKTAKEKYNTKTITGVFTNKLLGGKRYDLITLSHVAEHLNNAQFIFSEIHKSLNDNGLLFIEVPDMDLFDEKNMYQFFFEHINYFNTKSLSNLLNKVGFILINEIVFENSDGTSPFYPTTGTLWKKSNNSLVQVNDYGRNKKTINKYIELLKTENNLLNNKIDSIIDQYKNIAIWAGGTLTAQLLAQTNLLNVNVINIFDNDPKKIDTKMGGVMIAKPQLLPKHFLDKNIEAIIIGSWSSQEEIFQSLRFLEEYGISIVKLFDKVN